MNAALAAKQAMRAAMRARRLALPADVQRAAAAQIAGTHSGVFGPPGCCVAGYVPIRGEIDPGPLMVALHAAGLHLALPRVDNGTLSFRRHDPDRDLVPGAYGILEPRADAPAVAPDVLLVPLLAFDQQGGRLGYGAGFYDRAIAGNAQVRTIGLAYAAQEVESVPMEAHDRRLDAILTEAGLIDCRGGPAA